MQAAWESDRQKGSPYVPLINSVQGHTPRCPVAAAEGVALISLTGLLRAAVFLTVSCEFRLDNSTGSRPVQVCLYCS